MLNGVVLSANERVECAKAMGRVGEGKDDRVWEGALSGELLKVRAIGAKKNGNEGECEEILGESGINKQGALEGGDGSEACGEVIAGLLERGGVGTLVEKGPIVLHK